MTPPTFFEKHLGQPLESFVELDHDRRSGVTRNAISDLHFFFDSGASLEERDAPARTRDLALSLHRELSAPAGGAQPGLTERIVTDAFLRSEADRDQNVYLGRFFTRVLTRAVPDVLFQPATINEAARTLRWARHHGVPVTLRGAASTAMGGAVPNDGGITLDLSRLDEIEIDAAAGVCVVGAGARLRTVHQRLAEQGLALRSYPSNLGGTLAGWFVTGGIGLNAYGAGTALQSVRAADVALPGGEHVRFHDDGRLDVPDAPGKRRTLGPETSADWFTSRGYPAMTLADLAGSEGVFGLLLHLTVAVEPRPAIGAFLLSFDREDQALEAATWMMGAAAERCGAPANLKFLTGSHLDHVRRVWKDEAAREWRTHSSRWSDGSGLPWTEIRSPAALGATCREDQAKAAAHVFVDFFDLDRARRFAKMIAECPGSPRVLDSESARFAAERFRPQQSKRLGPGLIAAEIRMAATEVPRFLPRAARLAHQAGQELESEVYFLSDGSALVIAGYLTDHTRAAFALDLMIAPALLDLAMREHRGRPYVLGRWQAAYLENQVGRDGARRVRSIKRALDANAIVNRGVLTGLRLRGLLGAFVGLSFVPAVRIVRAVYETPALAWLARGLRSVLEELPGPASGRGAAALVGARFVAGPPAAEFTGRNGESLAHAPASGAVANPATSASAATSPAVLPESNGHGSAAPATAPAASSDEPTQAPEDRALHCVNCGECNSVCPIFHESKIRLPQMLTHLGEAMRGRQAMPATGSVLLDLCMRCGNCEEVCQAGIPHLPLYQVMQRASDRARPRDRERHASIVATVRGSSHYTRDFLDIRPGGYHKRSPAALPGMARFVVLRAENDAGPAATCIHCGACVPVCPTHANRDLEGADPRWITTSQDRCIGCGSCVEVCPANHLNGGQTLRVMEAPARDFFMALERFEEQERG
jgi:FAD/FMN-containing dehydrogenase/ferredoxin